jgi:putative membrane protein
MATRSRIAKLAATIVTLPITLAVILFAVSNRHFVALEFWPFPGSLELPLYAVGLVTMVVGFLIGGIVAWLGAGESRQRARVAEREARSLETRLADAQSEVEKARALAPPANAPAE